MTRLSKSSAEAAAWRRNTQAGRRAKRKRQHTVESLESRTLLTFTFTYGGVNGPQTVNESGGNDSFTVVNNGFGLLEWSTDDGATFSTQWGANPANTLNASPAVSLTINQTGDNADVIDGVSTIGSTASQSASAVQARIVLNPNPGLNGSTLTVDDSESNLGTGTYTLSTSGIVSTITGPLDDIHITSNLGMSGGATLLGSNANNVFNVPAVSPFQSMRIVGGSGDNTVNAGTGTSVGGILAPLSVTDPTGTATLNVDDSADTTSSTATLSGATPYELTGLSIGAIEYGAGVTALNITGGIFGANGASFDINNTQAITTTTITGGANQNFFNLSNAPESGGLDNLPGPVSILGGASISDVVTLDDSSADFNDTYTITSTTVSRTVFGGLTYDDNIGTLTLNAENTLNSVPLTGNNTININSTANVVTTNISGLGGNDTINVNSTGSFGVVNVATGSDGTTVNVVADNEPVNLNLGDGDVVNIGSTGGAGTMAGILGAIGIIDTPDFYVLTFHDENDTISHIWTLNNDDSILSAGSASVALSDGIATTTYRPGDLSSQFTINGGSSGNTFNVNQTTSFVDTNLNTGVGNDTVNVLSTGTANLNIEGQDGSDTVTLGGLAGIGTQKLGGTINVTNSLDFSSLTLDDSEDLVSQTALLSDDGTTGTVTGLSSATIHYTDFDISSLTVLGGSGGNFFTVEGTLVNSDFPSTLTTLNEGAGVPNTVHVFATSAGSMLEIFGSGGPDFVTSPDFVTIGDGNTGTILGSINIDGPPGSTILVIDLSTDDLPHNLNLASEGTTATLSDTSGNLPKTITYKVAALSSLEIDTDATQDETLNVSFAGGDNPIPTAGSLGLIFNAGDPIAGVTHALNISGELPSGAFASETHNAKDPNVFPRVGQFGSIVFTESAGDAGPRVTGIQTVLDYTGLQSITDTAPATLYTFNDFGWPDQSFSVTVPGTLLPGSLEFSSIPTPASPLNFATTDVLNKIHIVFNTPVPVTGQPGDGAYGLVNVPTASAGLTSLTFNVSTGNDNTVEFLTTPAAVITTLDGSTAHDTTNVTGLSVASGTTLTLFGGPDSNILNYNAGGAVPTMTQGPLPNEMRITIPGGGTVDAFFYTQINLISEVSGTVYLDLNANGVLDTGEPGLAGRVVFLDLHHDGILDPGDPTATTDANGNFTLSGASSGIPVVVEATALDTSDRYVVDQTRTVGSVVTIGIVPISPVAPVPVVPNPFSTSPSTNPNTAYVQSLYFAVLGRAGTSSEVTAWSARMTAGTSVQEVAAGFINSIEHRQDEVRAYYEDFLHRAPGPDSAGWVNALLSGASEEEVAEAILDSPEYQAAHQDPTLFIRDLYLDVLGRQGGSAEVAAWQASLASGTNRETIVAGFVNSTEAIDQVVDSFYTAYLHRSREQGAASNGWVNMLETPNGSASDMAIGILSSTEFHHDVVTPQS